MVNAIGESTYNNENTNTKKVQHATTGREKQNTSDPNKEDLEKSDKNISVNELVTMCVSRYLNLHLRVTIMVVYNYNVFSIMSSRNHSGINNTIENVADNIFIG